MMARCIRYYIVIYIDGEYDATLLFNGLSVEDVKNQFRNTLVYRIISYEFSGNARILYVELETMYIE